MLVVYLHRILFLLLAGAEGFRGLGVPGVWGSRGCTALASSCAAAGACSLAASPPWALTGAVSVSVHIYIYIYIYVYTRAYIYVYIYAYVYIYIYVYTYIHIIYIYTYTHIEAVSA